VEVEEGEEEGRVGEERSTGRSHLENRGALPVLADDRPYEESYEEREGNEEMKIGM